MIAYLGRLKTGKIVLWCYLIWYLSIVWFYFDPSPRIWLNALGISAVIGIGLNLSVARPAGTTVDFWQTFRLFMMPFAVSSFLVPDQGTGFSADIPPCPAGTADCGRALRCLCPAGAGGPTRFDCRDTRLNNAGPAETQGHPWRIAHRDFRLAG
jgi:hypothetical protein